MGILTALALRSSRPSERLIDRIVYAVERGRCERSLSGLTAFAAAKIYLERYRVSFGHTMMWSPILLTAVIYPANGLIGEYHHARGVSQKDL